MSETNGTTPIGEQQLQEASGRLRIMLFGWVLQRAPAALTIKDFRELTVLLDAHLRTELSSHWQYAPPLPPGVDEEVRAEN